MDQHIYDSIVFIWSNQIKVSYNKGLLCSERQLQAELYHYFKINLFECQVWVEPTLELENEAQKWKIKPDILVTKGTSIEAIIEIKNVPYAEADFLPDIKKMVDFQNAVGKKFQLETDPTTGLYHEDPKKHFTVANEIICAYAAIARGKHAWAVEDVDFWLKNKKDLVVPNKFLHLVGRIYKQDLGKENYFGIGIPDQ